nr:hypothetical protein [Tanacetum cinerariifolium]
VHVYCRDRFEEKGFGGKIGYWLVRLVRAVDVEITLVDDTQGRMNEEDMFRVNDLDGDEVSTADPVTNVGEVVTTKNEVSTADPVTTTGKVVTTVGIKVTTVATTP